MSREVRIYEQTTQGDVVTAPDRPEAPTTYSEVNTALVAQATSGSDGFYEIELEPGTYSVFVEDEGDWYCNSFSSEGLCIVTVETDSVTTYDIRIDYMAAY